MRPPFRPVATILLAAAITAAMTAAAGATPAGHASTTTAGWPGAGAPARPAAVGTPLPAWDVTGYVEDGPGADNAIRANKGSITTMGLDTSNVTSNGRSVTAPDTGPVAVAHGVGARATFLVSNFGTNDFSPSLGAKVLQSAANRSSVAEAIAAEVAAGHWDGATIDFESLYQDDRSDLVLFVEAVRAALPTSRTLAIDVPASSHADDPYIRPFDDKALAAHVDEVVLMAYDEHYQGGTAGPVSGLPWVRASLRVALDAGVPPSELQLGEAGYGYRWFAAAAGKTPRSVQVGDAQARAIAAKAGVAPVWSSAQSEWHVTLPDGSVMWWSDARAMALDSTLATGDHLRGVAVWQLILSDRLPTLPSPR